mgnify:CR=1 FL=1
MNERPKSIIDKISGLDDLVTSLGEPVYRARQIKAGIFHRLADSYQEMTDIPARLRDRLSENGPLHCLHPLHLVKSKDGTVKGLFSLLDGNTVEAALMLYRRSGSEGRRATICVSTQVGCVVGCPFCATGGQGFVRNLSSGEIIDQVRQTHRLIRTGHNDSLCMDLLANRAILQYLNDKEWYGLNPLLPKRTKS